MTPKEKAIELVSKMYNVDGGGTGIVEKSNSYFPNGCVHWYDSKKYALIVVDEIIGANMDDWSHSEYWQQVKSEIEAL
jgi:hypothetical protein